MQPRGHREIVEVLLAHGADANIGDCYNRTAAEYAMSSNMGDCSTACLKGLTSLSAFCPLHEDEAKARSLIEAGADVTGDTR